MRSQQDRTFIRLGLNYFLVILVVIFFMTLAYSPYLTWGQSRSLGFRGLVPPPNAKRKKFKGEVVLTDLPLIRIRDIMRRSIKVFVGPPSFLNEQGFHIRRGQRLIIWAVPVKIEGKKILVAFSIEDKGTGRKIFLRDEKGEPIWWGGNRKPGSQGKKKK